MKKYEVQGHHPSYLPEENNWKLVWSDEFDGTELDLTKWDYRLCMMGKRHPAWEDGGVTLDGNSNAVFTCYEKDGKAEFVEADKVLLSIGRRANTKDIGLEAIGVYTERGAIVTDERMKTNQPDVYAAGDVNGKSMLAHTAYREAEVAVNNILGKKDNMRYFAIPGVLYTNPELSNVGETEYTAKKKGMDVRTVKLPMQFAGRYVAENEGGNGIMKLVVDNRRNVVVGGCALSNYSSEFIIALGSYIELGLTLDEIKQIVFPHPTVSEIIREAVFQA